MEEWDRCACGAGLGPWTEVGAPLWAITHGGWERGFVLASRPLTNEKRRDLEPGRLLVIREGTAVYGVARF
jgi:predicted glutamine amidotransferase